MLNRLSSFLVGSGNVALGLLLAGAMLALLWLPDTRPADPGEPGSNAMEMADGVAAMPSDDTGEAIDGIAGPDGMTDPGQAVAAGAPDLAMEVPGEVIAMAMRDWGYIPRDVDPGAVFRERLSFEDILVVAPARLDLPSGEAALAGVEPFAEDLVCTGAEGIAFDCMDWVVEGIDLLLAEARSIRCERPDEAGRVSCRANVGDGWQDVGGWAVRAGLLRADPEGPYLALQQEARSLRRGLWVHVVPGPDHLDPSGLSVVQ